MSLRNHARHAAAAAAGLIRFGAAGGNGKGQAEARQKRGRSETELPREERVCEYAQEKKYRSVAKESELLDLLSSFHITPLVCGGLTNSRKTHETRISSQVFLLYTK